MPGRLKLIPEFSKKAITEYLTSSRVVTEKPCYLFASLISPYLDTVDCQVRLRNGEMVTSEILLNLKTQYEQCMHHYTPPIYFNRGLYVELVGEILSVLDDCGDTSNISLWVEWSDGLAPVDNQVYVKEGVHSMGLGIDADKNPLDQGYWRNTESQGDLSAYQNDWIYIWVYFGVVEYLLVLANSFQFQIGTDVGNRDKFYFANTDLSVGWNLLKCDLDNPDATDGVVD